MRAAAGRLEKRIRLVIPVQIIGADAPGRDVERTTTENVSSRGVRVVARRRLTPSQRLVLTSPQGDRRVVRVIYCERLPDGRYAAGLQYQGMTLGRSDTRPDEPGDSN